MKQTLVIAVLVVVALYAIVVALAWAGQESVLWQPPREADPATSAKRISYSADDGQPLFALLVGNPAEAKGIVVAFHGNAETAAWNVDWANEVVRRTGWAVLLPEYRGYGGLTGSPNYRGSHLDALAAWRAARALPNAASHRIVLYGHSLGTAVASELAAEHVPAALVLASPFTSVREMVPRIGGRPLAFAWPLIGRIPFDTRARVASLDAPVFVVHGDVDGIIPVSMGRAVHAAARKKGELLVVNGAGHNDIVIVGGDRYWDFLVRALAYARE